MPRIIETWHYYRSMNSFGQPNAIRVTIGTQAQNQQFIKELHQCLKQL